MMFYNSQEIEEKIKYISKGATLFDMLTVGVVLVKTVLLTLSIDDKGYADTIKKHVINFLEWDVPLTKAKNREKMVNVSCDLCGNKFEVPEKDKDIGARICPNHSFRDFSQYNN